ncbi:sulfatase-like hydrolase/transferase [Pelagicoccus mobilis]|uniref:Sulfatase-like hydrolase/transferase n=1 Tax=Pelagicoccus mobilis TaxID=415221 RepID=A0A934RUC5_9BACT|nr:sulfatase-like hydrolase/transferase [Pelagicoccus mobilis]MBK1875279.1 sulfatase-like hydrolase/transferase [Pelagicoccus mobilis]
MRKSFTLPLLAALLFANFAYSAKDKLSSEGSGIRPNIIFILSDDQRADSVGYMGNKIVQTPELDRLATEGQIFDQAFVTSAICTPSRACYMLGQYERKHGINFNSGTSMSDEAWSKSYPVILRENGYFTGYIGKNHLPIGKKGYFTGLMDKSFDYWYAGHHHIKFYSKESHEIFDNAEKDTQIEIVTEGALAFLDPESNEAFMENAIQFLGSRPDDQPFCLSIALNLPHGAGASNMQQRESDDELYKTAYREYQDTLPLPPHYVPHNEIKDPKLPADVHLAQLRQVNYDYVNEPATIRERNIREMQAITGIDRMIGKLRKQLEALGVADNTVIIYGSDHGIFNGEHGLGGKSFCYETNLQIPFIVYDPRLPARHQGQRNQDLVLSVDVAPTILSMAGIDIPDTMQGSDLSPLLRGNNASWRQYAYGENLWSNIFGNPRCETVRSAEYRYIRYFANDNLEMRQRTPKNMFYTVTDEMRQKYKTSLTSTITGEEVVYEELFHIASDRYEAVNLATDPAYADVLETMRAKCAELVAEAKGDLSTPPSTYDVDHKWTKTNYRKL